MMQTRSMHRKNTKHNRKRRGANQSKQNAKIPTNKKTKCKTYDDIETDKDVGVDKTKQMTINENSTSMSPLIFGDSDTNDSDPSLNIAILHNESIQKSDGLYKSLSKEDLFNIFSTIQSISGNRDKIIPQSENPTNAILSQPIGSTAESNQSNNRRMKHHRDDLFSYSQSMRIFQSPPATESFTRGSRHCPTLDISIIRTSASNNKTSNGQMVTNSSEHSTELFKFNRKSTSSTECQIISIETPEIISISSSSDNVAPKASQLDALKSPDLFSTIDPDDYGLDVESLAWSQPIPPNRFLGTPTPSLSEQSDQPILVFDSDDMNKTQSSDLFEITTNNAFSNRIKLNETVAHGQMMMPSITPILQYQLTPPADSTKTKTFLFSSLKRRRNRSQCRRRRSYTQSTGHDNTIELSDSTISNDNDDDDSNHDITIQQNYMNQLETPKSIQSKLKDSSNSTSKVFNSCRRLDLSQSSDPFHLFVTSSDAEASS